MVREVMIGVNEGGADFAVADLSVTSARAQAVQFSMPWMTLGWFRMQRLMLSKFPLSIIYIACTFNF